MDCVNESIDFAKFTNPTKYMENLTPHKIAVVAFIREFCMLKRTLREPGIDKTDLNQVEIEPKHRKDFCILALKLIQCPDMEFKEFEALLTDGKYNLLSLHLQNFCTKLQYIYVNGIGALVDCVTSTVDKLITEHNTINPCVITRNSVLGFYLRRIMVYLVKLTFVQLSSLYKSFCLYYQKGRPGLMIRSLSKEKLNSVEQLLGTTPVSPIPIEESKPFEYSIRMGIIDRDVNFEECQWSRKQAALFTAQQANLIEINEPKAMPPKQLQKTIKQIINDIPDYADVHFLSFLNCLRVKEFCGAQVSLYNYFDRTIFTPVTNTLCNDRNKNFRYAALNRAAMHFQFGHKEMAMESVHEAMVLAQEAGDAACLAHIAAWAARAGSPAARGALLPAAARRPRLSHTPNSAAMPTAAAAAVCTQLLAQHRALNAAHPSHVFNLIVKGDAINYLHSMTDLAITSLATTAALWSLYGKTEMASICCQLLLNLNTKCGSAGGVWHWTSGVAAAVAGVVATAAWRGDLTLAAALTSHHPAPEVTRVAHRTTATICLYAGRWEEAEQSINQLASIDRWESQLLKAEMYYYKGEPTLALLSVNDVLDNCITEDDSEHFVSLRLRAMILTAQVQHSFGGIQDMNSSNIIILNKALTLAHKYNLHYLGATIEMHISNMQLHMGATTNALMTVKRVLPTIMAHGGAYDMARAVLLYTKCMVASAPTSGAARTRTLQSCCHALENVKKNFAKVEAHSRIMGTWYLQAQIYNEIGNHAARNQCAWMYHQLESQYSIEPSNTLLLSY